MPAMRSFLRHGVVKKYSKLNQLMACYGRLRSFRVIETGTNQQLVCYLLLTVNTNLGHTFYRFRDIAGQT